MYGIEKAVESGEFSVVLLPRFCYQNIERYFMCSLSCLLNYNCSTSTVSLKKIMLF